LAFKLIEIATPEDRLRAILAIAAEFDLADVQIGQKFEDGRHLVTLIAGEIDRQALLDRLQGALGKSDNWRITMLPADTVIEEESEEKKKKKEKEEEERKATEAEDDEKKKEEQARASREELKNLVSGGVHLDSNFLLLVFLSTVVASVGLAQDSVAILIGAMVIAPLLGPNVAFSFGAAIGDRDMMLSAARAAIAGTALAILIAALLALVLQPDIASHELLARTTLGYAGIALALASGAAAALSVTTGLSSTLVGVMVAVALLPPSAALGITLALGHFELATGAGMLLVANVASINLAAQLVFLAKGIKPRTWNERQSARRAVAVNVVTWVALIAVLMGVIALRTTS
jgi:uncharacterized hydrophobic protein (TIGR00341 family)